MRKVIFIISLLILLIGCGEKSPPQKVDNPNSYLEERYYLGMAKGKYLLTIVTFDVHSVKDYRQKGVSQLSFDSYEEMFEAIKERKK